MEWNVAAVNTLPLHSITQPLTKPSLGQTAAARVAVVWVLWVRSSITQTELSELTPDKSRAAVAWVSRVRTRTCERSWRG